MLCIWVVLLYKSYLPCACTHVPVGRCLCSVVEAWSGLFCACLFTRRRTADDLYFLQDYLRLFETFLRGMMKLVAAIGRTVCLISVYKSQWTWISAMGIIGLVMEVRVLGTPFTGVDFYFWEYVKRLICHGKAQTGDELKRHIMDCDVLMRNIYESTWKATGTVFQRTRLCVVIAGGHCEQ